MYTLNDVCTKITDGSHFSPEDEGQGYPMFSVKDMQDNDFDFSACKHIGLKSYQQLVANDCRPLVNDVVVAKDGSYLKTAFPIKEDREIAVLSSIAILRPNITIVSPQYLSYYLKSISVYRTVSLNYITGTALKRVILAGLKKLPIQLPDLEEQKARAALLEKAQSIITKRKKQLEIYDALIKARFVEMFGDMTINPNGWRKHLLGEVCDVRDGTHDSPKYYAEGYPLVTSKNVTAGEIDLTDCSLICEGDYIKINHRSKVDYGDILMPMIGTVGKPVIVNIKTKFAIKNVALIKFKEKSMVINSFVKALLESDYFDNAVISKVRGGTQKFISLGDIRNLEICLPPLDQQKIFESFLERLDKSKVVVQKALSEAQLLFDSLMQQYFG